MTGNPNPNPSAPMEPRSRALTLILALVLAAHSPLLALSSGAPSPSPSPSPAPFLPPPKQLMADPAGLQLSPPGKALQHPPPQPRFSCPSCHHPHHPGAVAAPPGHEGKLNFGQLMGIVLAGVAVTLQVALGGFLVYKRLQLRKAERRDRLRRASSSSTSY